MVERVKLKLPVEFEEIPVDYTLRDVVPERVPQPPQLAPYNDVPKRKRSKNNVKQIADNVRKLGPSKGYLPHQILLRIAQGRKLWHGKDEEGNKIWIQPTLDDRIRCAIAAAPYYAPKLNTIEIIQGTREDELDEIIRTSAAAAGVSISFSGEGEKEEFSIDDSTTDAQRFNESKEVDT